ncbi:MAG: sulfurtransferase [Lysobacterales bacterium]|nr:MAG: sulfurtransferase [Xanthomonadales bacterium]
MVSAAELEARLGDGRSVVVDCRFEMSDPDKGRADWLAGHIPGAAYAHLDHDLSSPVTAQTGRHPLPNPDRFSAYLASIGWTRDTLLVAYDEGSNAVASRLWWLMKYFGQRSALLDGGLTAWVAAGFSLESGAPQRRASKQTALVADPDMAVDAAAIVRSLGGDALLVLDARASQRYSGEMENLDSRAGHIPGALNRPFGSNLAPGGRFKAPQELREEFAKLLGNRDTTGIVHSCGSGVTACHNLFAMELAGMGGTRLYPGSWSEWIRDPARPIATGS